MAKQIQSKETKPKTTKKPAPKRSAEVRALCVPKSEQERFEIQNIIGVQYLKGAGAYDIHRHLLSSGHRLSVKSVYNYIDRLKKEWLDNRLSAVDEWVAKELAKIDLVEVEAWEAWSQSKKDRQKSFQKTSYHGEPKEGQTPKIKGVEATKTTEVSDGNAEFLKIVQWCIDKRLEIIGFGKLNINIQNNNVSVENRVSSKFSGGLTIIRDIRERPEEEVQDATILQDDPEPENFN